MGTIADKLEYLNQTKAYIKQALIDKGVEVADTDTFRSYATKIAEIQVGAKTIEIPIPNEQSAETELFTYIFDEDTILFSFSGTTTAGVWRYKISTDSVSQLYTSYYNYRYFQRVGDKCLISGTDNILLVYNPITDSIYEIYSEGIGFKEFAVFGDKCLAVNYSEDIPTVVVYNSKNDSITKLYENLAYRIVHTNENIAICAGASIVSVYSADDDSFTRISGLYTYTALAGRKCFLSNGSISKGLWVYDIDNKTTTKIYSEGYRWEKVGKAGNKYFISCTVSANPGVLVYDGLDDSCNMMYSTGYNYQYIVALGNDCFLGSTSGVLLYDYTSNTITQKYPKGFTINKVEQEGNNYYIYTGNYRVLYYNSIDKTIKLVKYIAGEI